MNLLIILSFFIQTDSLVTVSSDSITPKSIMFQPKQDFNTSSYKYNHIQGFFCDFEDKVNKNKKIKLNVGVGEQ